MNNEKKLKNLTEVFDHQNAKDEVKCGIMAYENFKYKQAYDHLYKAFKDPNCDKETKGETCFYLALTLLYSDNDIIEQIEDGNTELVNERRVRGNIKGIDARKVLTRKYLYEGARLENVKAMSEYGLNCIRLGVNNAFVFDSTDANREAAIAWANRLKYKEETFARVAYHIIYAKYYMYQSTQLPSNNNIVNYCENVVKAYELNPKDQRACYFMAIMSGDERIKKTNYAEYYDLNESFRLFNKTKEILENEDYPDSAITSEIDKYIAMYKKNFPNMR